MLNLFLEFLTPFVLVFLFSVIVNWGAPRFALGLAAFFGCAVAAVFHLMPNDEVRRNILRILFSAAFGLALIKAALRIRKNRPPL